MKQKGFTLIELLVVISIIGLLASVVLVALNGARSKARDAKRVMDLKQLQTALEMYYNQYGSYPYASEGGTWANAWANFSACLKTGQGCLSDGTGNIANYQPVVVNVPEDPQYNSGTGLPTYYYNTYLSDPACPRGSAYRIAVQLETNSPALSNSTGGSFYNNNGLCNPANKWFCVGSGVCTDFN